MMIGRFSLTIFPWPRIDKTGSKGWIVPDATQQLGTGEYHRRNDGSWREAGPRLMLAHNLQKWLGKVCPLCPGTSDINLFCDGERIVDLDA